MTQRSNQRRLMLNEKFIKEPMAWWSRASKILQARGAELCASKLRCLDGCLKGLNLGHLGDGFNVEFTLVLVAFIFNEARSFGTWLQPQRYSNHVSKLSDIDLSFIFKFNRTPIQLQPALQWLGFNYCMYWYSAPQLNPIEYSNLLPRSRHSSHFNLRRITHLTFILLTRATLRFDSQRRVQTAQVNCNAYGFHSLPLNCKYPG
ncbi:hypothetical protein C8F04DRAFT_1242781 [Mycena alexandri]|uniref:Uncharacterized protein n=1 Tax=Mycena alexandri TaxID=1745969 RepID=A0AAD6S0T0_9AGAR|nr:hypothetical protein C8F04DRAFT_1242781 [Mycena alexandri]